MATRQTATKQDGATGWTDSAGCDGSDTRVYLGERLVGLVGQIRHRLSADDRPHASDRIFEHLRDIDTSSDPVTDLVALLATVHEDAQGSGAEVSGSATVTAVVRDESAITIVHVGDASAVRIRHGAVAELTPLNCQHTLAAELQAAGRHPNARASAVITRVVGSDEPLTVDVTCIPDETGASSFVLMGAPSVDLRQLVRNVALATDASTTLTATRHLLPPGTAAAVSMLTGSHDGRGASSVVGEA